MLEVIVFDAVLFGRPDRGVGMPFVLVPLTFFAGVPGILLSVPALTAFICTGDLTDGFGRAVGADTRLAVPSDFTFGSWVVRGFAGLELVLETTLCF